MSIFKETLEDSIQTQLQARTLVVNGVNNNRNQLLPWYLSKNSWVRMTSFVNFTSGKELSSDEKGKLNVVADGSYRNDQLSKKYILEGGTLYTRSTGADLQDSILRYGIGSPQSVYGGDIDVRANNTADPEYFRTFGIRPMPGITDVDLRTVGAYGSLFETTVKFYAWDINQLNELEILFMRPGYSVLLEWGWSQYIDYGDNLTGSKATLEASSIYPTVFNGITINPFESLSQDDIYKKLEALRKKYRHNYDGMLGYVKNFNWTMMTNGGFECTTTLISMGEAINTIKMSSNVSVNTINPNFTANPNDVSNYAYDEYENILLSLKAKVDSKNYLDREALLENEYSGSWDYNQNFISIDKIKETVIKYYPDQLAYFDQIPYLQEVVFQEPSDTGRFFEYLPLNTWLAIVNSYFNVKTNNTKNSKEGVPLVKFELPGENDLCLACKDSISIDPKICQVKNQGAFKKEMSFFGFNGKYKPEIQGINPPMYFINNSGTRITLTDDSFKFYDETLKAGKIRNILVNISFLLSAYKDMKNNSNDEGVILSDYVKNVLNKISNSLGGLNNFNLSTVSKNHNTTKVVDLYYLESGANNAYTSKYQFDLLGLGSICRNVNIQSQIFENQSTIVAIAAQSRANLANVYNSSQVYLNAGLEDRVALNKWQGEELNNTSANKDDIFYIKLYNLMLYARDYLIGNFIQGRNKDDQYQIYVDTSGQANPNSILKQSMLRYNNELNFKALIPFKLRITIDGIGGIVVGQIFTLKQNILPKNYYDKKLGFVITQINHRLSKNDWETELETQICILDQEVTPSLKNFININRKGFGDFVAIQQAKSILYPILIDFLIYQATRSIIGYVYASTNNYKTFKGGGAKFIYDFLYNNFDQQDIQEYWIDNQSQFVGDTRFSTIAPVPGTNNSFQMYEFEEFVVSWMKTWTSQQSTATLNEKFSSKKTLQELSDFIINKNYLSNTVDEEYKEFKSTLDAVSNYLINLDLKFFYPVASPNSIYYDPSQQKVVIQGNNSVLNFNFGQFGGLFILDGWNIKNLVSRIDSIISRNTNINNLASFYNSNTVIANLKPLNNYFTSCGKVMYGDTNSLILKQGIVNDGRVLGNFAFGNSQNLLNVDNVKSIDETFAKTIYWNTQFVGGIFIRTNPPGRATNTIFNLDPLFYREM